MKLEKFKEKNNKKKSITIFTICCILFITGVFLYQSFALFETRENFNFIEGKVEDPGDIYFAYYVDDALTYDMPSKDSGYTLSSKSNCTNGVSLKWDDIDWMAKVYYKGYKKENNSRVKCNLYFERKQVPTFEETKAYLKSKSYDWINDDETVDHNLRYIGGNPKNYIDIGDRDSEGNIIPWRIIGIMNNVDDGTGKRESRIKIIRARAIGSYSWDTSASTVNGGGGVNEWSQADVMKLLNPGYENESVGGSLYWNRQSGNCYNDYNNATTSCDFTSSGLFDDAKNVIGDAVWYTGAYDGSKSLAPTLYSLERGSNTGKICKSGSDCNDTVSRTTSWAGKIGLIYPSDYKYAVGNDEFGINVSREDCLNDIGGDICMAMNWLFVDGTWTIMPVQSYAFAPIYIGQYGYFDVAMYASNSATIYPTAYLLNSVGISEGNGTLDNMFKIVK